MAPGDEGEAASPTYRYAAFISYKRDADADVAQALFDALETYNIPKSIRQRFGTGPRCGRLFKDEDELKAENLPDAIAEALRESRYLIVVCSPEARTSPWIAREVDEFISLGRQDRILPVLARGAFEDVLPPALAPLQSLAVDLRAESPRDRRRLLATSKLRLLAAIIGCEFDDLRQRDAHRTANRLRWTAAVAVAVAVLSVSVLLYVLALRRISEDRRISAEARLTAATSTLDRLNNVIENQIPAGATPQDIKGILVDVIAESRRRLDHVGSEGVNEHDVDLMTHFYRAELDERHSDLDAALREYRTGIALGERALRTDGDDFALHHDIATSHDRIAQIARQQSKPALATQETDVAIAMLEPEVRAHPESLVSRVTLCGAYERRAELLEEAGDPHAIDAQNVVLRCMANGPPALAEEGGYVLVSAHDHLGQLYLQHAKPVEALQEYRASVAILETYLNIIPGRLMPGGLVKDYLAIARLLESAGQPLDAVQILDKALTVIGHYRQEHPESTVALADEWTVRHYLVWDSARARDEAALHKNLDGFLALEKTMQERLETTDLKDHIMDTLTLAHRLAVEHQPEDARQVALAARDMLDHFALGEPGYSDAYQLRIVFTPALIALLGERDVFDAFRRDAEACTNAATTAANMKLRCLDNLAALAGSDLRQGKLDTAYKYIEAATAFDAALASDSSTVTAIEHLRFVYASAQIYALRHQQQRARTLVAAAIPLAQRLVSDAKDSMDRMRAEVVLALLLMTKAELIEDANTSERTALLKEAIALLEKQPDVELFLEHGGLLLLLADTLLKQHDAAGAVTQLEKFRAILNQRQADGLLQIDQSTGTLILGLYSLRIDASVMLNRKADCDTAAGMLTQVGNQLLDATGRAALAQQAARCAQIH